MFFSVSGWQEQKNALRFLVISFVRIAQFLWERPHSWETQQLKLSGGGSEQMFYRLNHFSAVLQWKSSIHPAKVTFIQQSFNHCLWWNSFIEQNFSDCVSVKSFFEFSPSKMIHHHLCTKLEQTTSCFTVSTWMPPLPSAFVFVFGLHLLEQFNQSNGWKCVSAESGSQWFADQRQRRGQRLFFCSEPPYYRWGSASRHSQRLFECFSKTVAARWREHRVCQRVWSRVCVW